MDEQNQLIATDVMPTGADRPAGEVIVDIARRTLDFLETQNIDLDQCLGAGIGVPGTVDSQNGVVLYSNNIRWDHVEIVKEMERVLPIPVRIANDADCAALGEAVAGAAKGSSDMLMLTLGTGVGGGHHPGRKDFLR